MLALQDTLFRHAIDQAYGAVLMTTAQLEPPGPEIVYVNAAFCKQTGYAEDELIGQTPRILQGPETDRSVLSRLRTSLVQSDFFDGQTVNYRKDGSSYRVRWSIRPIRDEQQRVTHYISLQNDITDISVTQDELTRQAELLKMAEKTVRFGGWFINLSTYRIEWSNVVADIHGMPHGYSPSFSQALAYYIPEHRERIRQCFTACVEQGIPYDEELQILSANGQRVWVRTLGEPILGVDARIIGVRGALQDVTRRREREQELRRLAYITEQSPAPITVTDLNGHIEYVNRAFEQVSGYSRDVLKGDTPARIQSGHTSKATYRDLWKTIKAGHVWTGEIQNRRRDGTPYWEREMIAPLKDDLGVITNFVAIKQDITAIKRAEKELSRIAFEDPLTGLYSRVGFARELQAYIEKEGWQPEGVVVMVDIMGQRDINDAYGYDAGDALLIEFSRRLMQRSAQQRLAGRIGGDEFTLYLPLPIDGKSEITLEKNLEQLIDALTMPIELEGTVIELSVRVGFTRLDTSQRSIQELLREAERALFQHREVLSAPWVAYDHQFKRASQLRIQLTRELRQALEENQFELYFQPKVDLANQKLMGCETLLRWHHPVKGFVSPGLFIPIAEQSQLIAPIGDWVLRNACQHLKQWRDAGFDPVSISINVSLIQFQNGDLPERVRHVLKEYDIASELLVVELTESVFSEASDTLLSQMNALRDMGVRLSLDDFGTGYSSLLYLQQYPVDEIKIDQGFVFHLLDDAFSRDLVKAVIMLAAPLDADVLAEGIESAEIGEALRELGCPFGQGYYYSKPLRAETFKRLLAQRGQLPSNK
ncbi:sensor domain-containing protein [Vreelandella massiliensis]|uniref:sensor domain-containing protein n=1 Tax=Vreelandella massiliensis TaxID=1816686 RepID=UPI00096A9B7E|nr:GGDEF domain-containing phosphodiesterase [Halomonas massiliensis]